MAPAGRDRAKSPRAARAAASCAGLPPTGGDLTLSSPQQPLALFALPRFAPDAGAAILPGGAAPLSAPSREPLERPPRA
jgi:hypothetical protein